MPGAFGALTKSMKILSTTPRCRAAQVIQGECTADEKQDRGDPKGTRHTSGGAGGGAGSFAADDKLARKGALQPVHNAGAQDSALFRNDDRRSLYF